MRIFSLFLVTLLVVHLLLLTNIRFTAWPEVLSYPYLLSHGFKLYTDFIHPYPPLLTLLLAAVYKVFGFKILALKIFTWVLILASDVFLFLIVKKIFKKEFLTFLFLVPYVLLQSFLDGNMLWFDNALVLPVAGSIYYLINWSERKRSKDLLMASLFLTAGVFIKQTAVIYFLPAVFFAGLKNLWRFVKLPLIVGVLFVATLLATNLLKDFWLWNLYYPMTFWSKFPGYVGLSLSTGEKVVVGLTLMPLLAAIIVRKKITKDKLFFPISGFLVASLIAVYPRFSYFHLQPAFAILFVAFAIILSYLKQRWYLGLIVTVTLLAIYPTLGWSFANPVRFFDNVRFYDADDQKVIKMVSALSAKNERVYLVGLFSSVYTLADRLPPKPWADNFGWYWEAPGESDKILSEWQKDPPSKIFYQVPERGNWFDLGVYRPSKLLSYMYEHYYRDSEPIGGIELWKRKE